MVNYQLGKIYKIESNQCEQVYVGSTVQPLSKRMTSHRDDYKCYLNGKRSRITSFDILKYDDAKIYLIEDYPCERKEQLHSREGYWIKELDCVNKRIAGRSKKEWREENKDKIREKKKQYREENKDKIREKKKQWREENKDKIRDKDKQYREENKDKIKNNLGKIMTCEVCGKELTKGSKARHERSKFHLNFV